jgi:hypothetical protein
VQLGITVVNQGVDVTISDRPDTATFAAVAAIRTAERSEFFAAKTRNTVAAIASDDFDFCFVDKLHDYFLPLKIKKALPEAEPFNERLAPYVMTCSEPVIRLRRQSRTGALQRL